MPLKAVPIPRPEGGVAIRIFLPGGKVLDYKDGDLTSLDPSEVTVSTAVFQPGVGLRIAVVVNGAPQETEVPLAELPAQLRHELSQLQ